jgi:Zn-dependent protease with chaperone function
VAAVGECAQVVVPQASEQTMKYYQSGNVLWILQQLWSLGVPLLLLATGFSGKLASFAQKIGRNWFFTIVVYLIAFIALFQLCNLPLDFYGDYVREHAYGLSNQTLDRWFNNYYKSLLVTLIGALAFVWIFYLILKKSPKRWWFYGSLASMAFLFVMMVIQPIWIDPLFNKFGPMKNKELEQQILGLAKKAGIEGGRVFEVDKSQDTKALNAYVIGMGSTNRIVLWDTTINKLTPDQILFVMGHEMGHYVLHHLWWLYGFLTVISFVVFYLIYRISQALLKRYRSRFRFSSLSSIASLPLLLLVYNVLGLVLTPPMNYFSRVLEHHADQFGLEITQNNQAAGEAFVALQEENLSNPYPGPIYKFWRCTHPPLGERVEFCNSYCPWKRQEPLKYGKFFKND